MPSYKVRSPKFRRKKSPLLKLLGLIFGLLKNILVKLFRLSRKLFKKKQPALKMGGIFKRLRKLPKLGGLFRTLLTLGIVLAIAGLIVSAAAIAYYSRDLPDPNKLIDRQIIQSTRIYDRTGERILYQVAGDIKRTSLKLEEIPDYVVNAVIALEDKNFYQHHGLSPKRILLAAFKRLTSDTGPGASTLTQQLVKNAILTPERTIGRKLKEWVLTVQIERKFSKEEILQLYFNEIPWGSTAYGVEAAANTYFGKSARQLSLAEAAVLASMIKKPTYYRPDGNNVNELLDRQKIVLNLMVEQGYITKEEAEQAKQEEIKFNPIRESIEAPHFVFYVIEQLTENYGEKVVEQGGLKVITSLDYDYQMMAEEAVREGTTTNEKYQANNASLVAIEPKTGEILAMVGSKDYFDVDNDGNVNVAISLRQPGSSFKPIVYAASFIKGYTPETILYDAVTTFKTDIKDYTPHNYDDKEHGPVTIRQALAGSLNIPAVKTIYLTGVDRVLDLAEDMGYTSFDDRSRFGLSLVLGGGEVKLLEHVMAYTAFANDGEKAVEPISILKVQDKDGRLLEESKPKTKRVLPQEIARLINSILSDNNARAFTFGQNNFLTLDNRPVAAKTGTTNDYRDAWTVGYTSQLAAGVWVGNNDNSKMKRGADGSVVAAPIWNKFMSLALKDQEIKQFPSPPLNQAKKPVLTGAKAGEVVVKIDRASGLLATDLTPPSFIEEKAFIKHHNILHYLNKDNPAGPEPENPETADPQYVNWEEAVARWAKEQAEQKATSDEVELAQGEPPTEYDNLHLPENKPSLTILSPAGNQKITDNTLSVQISASAPRGISRAEYVIDGLTMAVVKSWPFSLDSLSLLNIDNGFHDLIVRVYDDIDNPAESKINFNLLADKPSVLIWWLGPLNGSNFSQNNFPLTLNVYVNKPQKVAQINFFYQNGVGQKNLITSMTGPLEETIFAKWDGVPASGDYTLLVEIRTGSGEVLSSDPIQVRIN